MSNEPTLVSTIGQLPPIDPELISGEESIEITVTTRSDGGTNMGKKTFRTTLNAVLAIYANRRDNPNEVTASQVGAYTIEQIQEILEGKLGVEGIAVNSLRLDGKTRQEIVEEARAGTAHNALHLGGRAADEYLTTNEYDEHIVKIAETINEMTRSYD